MGLSNAWAGFQRTIYSILAKYIQKGDCLVYLDDIYSYVQYLQLPTVKVPKNMQSIGCGVNLATGPQYILPAFQMCLGIRA